MWSAGSPSPWESLWILWSWMERCLRRSLPVCHSSQITLSSSWRLLLLSCPVVPALRGICTSNLQRPDSRCLCRTWYLPLPSPGRDGSQLYLSLILVRKPMFCHWQPYKQQSARRKGRQTYQRCPNSLWWQQNQNRWTLWSYLYAYTRAPSGMWSFITNRTSFPILCHNACPQMGLVKIINFLAKPRSEEDVLKTYAAVFKGLGQYSKEYDIEISKPDAKPVYWLPITKVGALYPKREKLKKTLDLGNILNNNCTE